MCFFFSINAEQHEDHFIEKDLFFKLFFFCILKARVLVSVFMPSFYSCESLWVLFRIFLCHFGDLSEKRI